MSNAVNVKYVFGQGVNTFTEGGRFPEGFELKVGNGEDYCDFTITHPEGQLVAMSSPSQAGIIAVGLVYAEIDGDMKVAQLEGSPEAVSAAVEKQLNEWLLPSE